MSGIEQLSDIDLAALVASKVCHDAIGPMTAIGFGLDVMDEDDDDEEQRENAVQMIKNGISAITAKLQFARLAFGAAGSSGLEIDMKDARKAASEYVENDKKHKVEWNSELATSPKNNVKLLLNLMAIALSAIPRGGVISADMSGDKAQPAITIRASGDKARVPQAALAIIEGTNSEEVDARSVQPYFTARVANTIGARIVMRMEGDDVLIETRYV